MRQDLSILHLLEHFKEKCEAVFEIKKCRKNKRLEQSIEPREIKTALDEKRRAFLSPLNARRWQAFKANRRGWWSLHLFLCLCLVALMAELIANDRPILASYKGEILLPILFEYEDEKFGGVLARADFRDPFIMEEIDHHGWALWPPVRYSYHTISEKVHALAPPFWLIEGQERCALYVQGADDPDCHFGNWHLLGTDDQARDVFARLLYGFRISIIFTLILTALSSVIGTLAGALQGYFGGLVDLIFQRFIEIWSSIPALYLLIILAAVLAQGFWILLGVMVLFGWISLVGVVRAEFLRTRNFDYVLAARALGVPNYLIIWRHLLPNSCVAALTYLPFLLTAGISTLTSLDFLGFGLPPPAPSLGELMRQATHNLTAPWIGIAGFVTIALMLSLLAFIGEAVRDAFDPRKG